MRKLVMLLALFALCASAYGETLIYKVSGRAKGIACDANSCERGSRKYRAYAVIDVNGTTGDFNTADPNNAVLIFYGKNDAGVKKQETFANVIVGYDTIEVGSYATWMDIVPTSWVYINVTGKAKARKIGGGVNPILPKLLKGTLQIYWSADPPITDRTAFGTGRIKAKLKTKWTRKINNTGLFKGQPAANQTEAVAAVEAYLNAKKGFTP